MKHLIVFAICLFGTASANYLHAPDIHHAPQHLHAEPAIHHPVALNTGSSTQYRSQDNIGNYNFGYNEQHATGGTFRRESGDVYGNKVGSYGLKDIDGRVRVVNYVADGAGFRAAIATNEPGTAAQPAAATSISSPHISAPHLIAPAPAVHAPAYAAAPAILDPHLHGLHGHGLHAAPSIAITGPAAILPAHLHHGHGLHAGLLAAPVNHYGLAHAHNYPIRR